MSDLQAPVELWGGVECTVNRVNEIFFDQLERSGHRERAVKDLNLFAELGIRTLRTALHWERMEATGLWDESDQLMAEMTRLRLKPIIGLLHHGSGPRSTNLLDPGFPHKLAAYALGVARRYPDVLDYTPVNEPQTTGRFACLYGYWYPHERNMRSYIRALYNQIRGVALSMAAIRTVQPAARLIHTEDGGQTFATRQLESFRVEREHRRWLGADLLCGRVTRTHPLFDFLREQGLSDEEVLWFVDNPCPPSVLGLNYYVTSDRFLDHRLDLYPCRSGGDTGTEPLVDVEAVRVRAGGIAGTRSLLQQAWKRYGLPVAITEAHLGCEPVEQTRWLAQIWMEAQAARADGVDVRAVTAWALLGSYNWCHLCTHDTGAYESGVYDVSTGIPTPTLLAELITKITRGSLIDGDATKSGWWHDPVRLINAQS